MRTSFVIAAGALTCALLAPLSAGAQSPPQLCSNAIQVQIVTPIDAAKAKMGQTFRFKTIAAVTFLGTPLPAGVYGYGIIRGVSPPAKHNHNGWISIEPRYLWDRKLYQVAIDPHMPTIWSATTPEIQQALGAVPIPEVSLPMAGLKAGETGKDMVLGVGFQFAVIPLADNLGDVYSVCSA